MNYNDINIKINDLEARIKALETLADESETVSAVELMRLREDLTNLRLQIRWMAYKDDGLGAAHTKPESNTATAVPPEANADTDAQRVKPDGYSDAENAGQEWPSIHMPRELREHNNALHTITSKISEVGIGKVVLSLVAALLIILAAGVFVKAFWGTFWGQVSDTVKAIILIVSGLLIGFAGIWLYHRKRLYPYIIIYAVGSAVSYIGIVAANTVYNAFGLYTSIALIAAWTALNLLCYIAFAKTTMLAVTSLGIIVSSALISGMAYDEAYETGVYPTIYTAVSGIMALMPLISELIPKIKERASRVLRPIIYGTAAAGIGISLCSAVSAMNIYKWNYDLLRGDYTTAVGSVSSALPCLVALVIIASFIYKINMEVKNIVIGKILTVIEIQSILAAVLAFSQANIIDEIGNGILGASVYLASVIAILLGGITYGGAYKLVAFNLAGGIAWLIGDLCPSGFDERLETTFYILAALVVYAVFVYGLPLVKKSVSLRDKILSLIPLAASLFAVLFVRKADEICLNWGYMLATTVTAFAIITHDILTVTRKRSEDVKYFAYEIISFLADILVLLVLGAVFEGYAAFAVSMLYLGFARAVKYRGGHIMYKLFYGFISGVYSIIVMCEGGSRIFGLDSFLYTIACFTGVGIFMSIAFSRRTHVVARVPSIILGMIMISVYISNVTDSSVGAILSVIIASSILLTLGFVISYRSVRITSLVTLLFGVLALIVSLSDFNSSMGTVTALLGSGVLVMITSIVYSKLERKMKAKETANIQGNNEV